MSLDILLQYHVFSLRCAELSILWQSPRVQYLRSKTTKICVVVRPFFNPDVHVDWYSKGDDNQYSLYVPEQSGPIVEVGPGTYRAKILYFGVKAQQAWCLPITVLPPSKPFEGERNM